MPFSNLFYDQIYWRYWSSFLKRKRNRCKLVDTKEPLHFYHNRKSMLLAAAADSFLLPQFGSNPLEIAHGVSRSSLHFGEVCLWWCIDWKRRVLFMQQLMELAARKKGIIWYQYHKEGCSCSTSCLPWHQCCQLNLGCHPLNPLPVQCPW